MDIVIWMALLVSFVLTLVIGRFLIPELRKMKAGQSIREDGPSWHAGKAGTPTMGGIMFILGTGVVILLLGWNRCSTVNSITCISYCCAGIRSDRFAERLRKVSNGSERGADRPAEICAAAGGSGWLSCADAL